MKKITTLLFLLLTISAVNLSAQKELSSGKIKMEITEVNSDNPQMAAQLEMMKGTTTEYVFSEDKAYTTSNMMGGMFTMQSLFDNDSEDLTLLIDVMGQKMMIESTKEDRKESEMEAEEAMKDVVVEYDESDTKEILGYKCIKANIKSPTMGMDFIMYVTEDIKASNKMIQGLQSIDLKGFPLEYIMKGGSPAGDGGMSMTYTATELAADIDPSIFELKTSGYTKMTFEEFQEQMGQFGGMGF